MIAGSIFLDAEYQNILIPEVLRTDSMFERMRGLLGKPPLEHGQALLLSPCSSIHTCFMQYPLDLVFLDRKWQIKKITTNLAPWRMAWAAGAAMVLETPANTVENMGLARGQLLYWKEKQPS